MGAAILWLRLLLIYVHRDQSSPVKNTWLTSNVDSDDDIAHKSPGRYVAPTMFLTSADAPLRKSKISSPNKHQELIADEASSDNEVGNVKISAKNKTASPRYG